MSWLLLLDLPGNWAEIVETFASKYRIHSQARVSCLPLTRNYGDARVSTSENAPHEVLWICKVIENKAYLNHGIIIVLTSAVVSVQCDEALFQPIVVEKVVKRYYCIRYLLIMDLLVVE